MSVNSYSDLIEHVGHDVHVVTYGNKENVAIECSDCSMILVDYDKPNKADVAHRRAADSFVTLPLLRGKWPEPD